jgi:hypothetical protein
MSNQAQKYLKIPEEDPINVLYRSTAPWILQDSTSED